MTGRNARKWTKDETCIVVPIRLFNSQVFRLWVVVLRRHAFIIFLFRRRGTD